MTAEELIEERFSDPNIRLDDIIKLMEDYAELRVEEELNDIIEDLKSVHCEYHKSIIESKLDKDPKW